MKNPFSFDGRIRRLEYIIYKILIVIALIILIISILNGIILLYPVLILVLLLNFSQSTKRCHDLGKSGWLQFIPFFVFFLSLTDGDIGKNKYGNDPKNRKIEDLESEQEISGIFNNFKFYDKPIIPPKN